VRDLGDLGHTKRRQHLTRAPDVSPRPRFVSPDAIELGSRVQQQSDLVAVVDSLAPLEPIAND